MWSPVLWHGVTGAPGAGDLSVLMTLSVTGIRSHSSNFLIWTWRYLQQNLEHYWIIQTFVLYTTLLLLATLDQRWIFWMIIGPKSFNDLTSTQKCRQSLNLTIINFQPETSFFFSISGKILAGAWTTAATPAQARPGSRSPGRRRSGPGRGGGPWKPTDEWCRHCGW